MIELTCTNCKTVLTMDDGFAGGVCRCQHCGAIQTVPSRLKGTATAQAVPVSSDRPAKTLYQRRSRADIGTGLDELADVVASSGMSSSGLIGATGNKKQKAAVARANRSQLVLAICAVIIIILGSAVIWLASRKSHTAHVQRPDTAVEPAPTPVEAPTFLDQPIEGDTVIYVIDRGTGTQKAFADIKEAVLRSIQSLGSDRKFQVVFWHNGSDDAFPTGSPAYATRTNVEGARRSLDNIAAFGRSDVASAMTKAIEGKPATVVLVTGKAWDLDDSFVETVMNLRKDAEVRIHTVAVGGAGDSAAFKTIADRTQGEYREVMEGELRHFVR